LRAVSTPALGQIIIRSFSQVAWGVPMRRLLPIAAFLVLATMAPSASWADAESDRVACFSLGNENYKDPNKFGVGLAACSRMINTGRFKDKGLASIYRARASWKQKKGELDAALADYGISIRIEPDNVESYDYRADVYQQQGDLDRALADYNHATRINPTYAAAYYSRGLIYEKKGDLAKAREEYNAAIAVPTVNRIAQWAQDNARARLQALALAKDGDKDNPSK
jgi:tetratricopeptide (TPR) repeat protein